MASGLVRAKRGKAERPVDLGGLDQRLGYVVRRAQVWIFKDVIRRMARYRIRPAQYSVMVVIRANPGIAQARLSTTLGIERAQLAALLDGLAERGFVERRLSDADRRVRALHLTTAGGELLPKLDRAVAEHERRVQARLGAEGRQQALSALMAFIED